MGLFAGGGERGSEPLSCNCHKACGACNGRLSAT